MRILLISNILATHTVRWAKALSAKHEILLYSFSAPSPDSLSEIEGVNFKTAGIRDPKPFSDYSFHKLFYLKAIPGIKRIIRDFKPDILHAHYATSYGFVGALTGFHPYIISVWGTDVYDFPERSVFHRLFLQYNLGKADIVLSTSHVMAQQTRKYVDKDILVTPFGIELDKFCKKRIVNQNKKNEIVIGTIKTLDKKYGIEYLIKAFKIIVDRLHDFELKLLIVGGGPDEKELKGLTRKLKIEDKTIFTGRIKHEDVPEYCNMIDIFVAVSILDSESFGVSVIEAGACEIPVVVSSVGGLKEVVDDGKTGYIVPPENPEETAKAIEKLILSEETRNKFGKNARTKINDLYNWEKNVDLMNSIYLKCINEK